MSARNPSNSSSTRTRNRAPCIGCKAAKRKCDLGIPRCSRCTQRDLDCTPSSSARWRVNTVDRRARDARRQVARGPPIDPVPAEHDAQHAATISSAITAGLDDGTEGITDPDIGLDVTDDFHASLGHSEGSVISSGWASGSFDMNDNYLMLFENFFLHPFQDVVWPTRWNAPPAGDFTVASEQLSYIQPSSGTPSSDSTSLISSLWKNFVDSIATGITLPGNEPQNLVVKYLADNALDKPPLFSAVIFLSHSVSSNWLLHQRGEVSSPQEQEDQEALGRQMELQATKYMDSSSGLLQNCDSSEVPKCVTSLSTLLMLCTAYIARGDMDSLTMYLELAMLLVQREFAAMQSLGEHFFFLVRWLGYIHTTALLCEAEYQVHAPDYLSIAANTRKESNREDTSERPIPDHVPSDARIQNLHFFSDIDTFLGVSHTVGELLYKIGRLLQARKSSSEMENSPHWIWQQYETDANDVEVRIRLLIRWIDDYYQATKPYSHLDKYNEALLRISLVIFLTRIKDLPSESCEVSRAVTEVLDACAAVPPDAPTAKLMILPLFNAGINTTRPLHQEFIRNRLQLLKTGLCIANVTTTLQVLEGRWKSQVQPLTNDVVRQSTVCLLF